MISLKTAILFIAMTIGAYGDCQVLNLTHQYRPQGYMNSVCVYGTNFNKVLTEANGQYCPSYIKYDFKTGLICE